MFGSVVIEVALGLVFTFLLFSIVLTSLQEGIESVFKGRAKFLERAIGELLDQNTDTRGDNVRAFFEHPLVFPLFFGSFDQAKGRFRSNLPSYIPGASFAKAAEDLGRSGAINSEQLRRVVDLADSLSAGGATTVQHQLEAWYDSAMERLTGQYKRNTHAWVFAIGLAAAVIGNVSAVRIGDALARNQQMRQDVGAAAGAIANQQGVQSLIAKRIQDEATAAGLPIGWDFKSGDPAAENFTGKDTSWYVAHVFGWLITALAGLLGAPFWFDMLQRIVQLRGAIKPAADAPPTAPATAAGTATDLRAPTAASPAGGQRFGDELPRWRDGFESQFGEIAP